MFPFTCAINILIFRLDILNKDNLRLETKLKDLLKQAEVEDKAPSSDSNHNSDEDAEKHEQRPIPG